MDGCGLFGRQHAFNSIDHRLGLRIDFNINPMAQLFIPEGGALQRLRDQVYAETGWCYFTHRQADTVHANKSFIEDVFH